MEARALLKLSRVPEEVRCFRCRRSKVPAQSKNSRAQLNGRKADRLFVLASFQFVEPRKKFMKQNNCRYVWTKARILFAFVCAAVGLIAQSAHATDPKWYAVQVSATVQASPAQITLTWPVDSNAQSYTIYRKSPTASSWSQIASLSGSTGSYTDTGVAAGQTYEYQVSSSTAWNYSGYGYVLSGINAPLVEYRGKVLLIVDSTYASDLASELSRLQQDLVGDGWTVVRKDVSRSDSPQNIKNLIKNEYNADPQNVKSVFLFGHVPVPYSGNFNPDGHPDHQGAWAADVYYGDIDGNWTDSSTYSGGATRTENKNAPGDGKFDQSDLPSNVDLEVGRVDLAKMTAIANTSGLTEKELLRQYLNKDHNFRHNLITAQRRGLICDNFGEKDGEAFSASGYRAFSAMFGANNVTLVGQDQYFPTLGSQDYLWSYGCGGGSYTTCYGVGSTEDFGRTDIKSMFTMLFGSYFGDWDSESNFLRGPLASKTYGLAAVWAGRPHWFVHPMALGETIGASAKRSQNNGSIYSKQNYGSRGVHVALMGDPTLRMHPVAPPANVTLNGSTVSWGASSDSSVQGYHVYRATSAAGPFTRVTSSPVTSTSYNDSTVSAGAYTYMVRAIKLERSGSGTYTNASQGIFVNGTTTGGSGNTNTNTATNTTPVVTNTVSVPTAPSGMTATVVSSNQINLSWTDTSTNESGFKVERKSGNATNYVQIATLVMNSTSYINSNLTAGTPYAFRVRAYNSAGDSTASSEVTATTSGSGNTNTTSTTTNSAAVYATYVTTDATAQGTWKGVYGSDGYTVIGGASSIPTYAQVTPSGKADWTWQSSTSDVRCPQKGGTATDRVAGCWYSSGAFTVDLNFTDGQAHKVAFYCLDWDNSGRAQTVQVTDAATGTVLNSQNVSAFSGGKYLVWEIKGRVKVTFTRTSGYNSVISGIFFDPATTSTPTPAPAPVTVNTPAPVTVNTPTISPNGGTFTNSVSVTIGSATSGASVRYTIDGSTPTVASTLYTSGFVLTNTATVKAVAFSSGTNSTVASASFTRAVTTTPVITNTPPVVTNPTPVVTNTAPDSTTANQAQFVAVDTTTAGNWSGVYGARGYSLMAYTSTLPSYAQVTASGKSDWIWQWSTTDNRGLQKPNIWSDREAGTWYGDSFTIDVNLTDSAAHRVAFYFVDWDLSSSRSQTVEISDATTGVVLNTQTVSNFGGGKYLTWDLKGHVKVKITKTSGYNAVLSGMFFGS